MRMRRLRSVFFAQAVLAVLLFVAALSRFCYLRLPRGFSHFIPAPAATAHAPRIRFATYNILSPTLAGGLGAGEAYRDPEYRLAKIKQKLLRECKHKSILGLQEVGLSWKGPLTAFFEAQNYRVVDTHYGSQGTDYMGTMLAYSAELYQAVDLKVERTADMLQEAPNREPALPYAERKAKEKKEREAREAAKAARIAAGRKQSTTEVAWEIASGAPNRVILAKLRVISASAAGDSSSSPGAGEDTTFVVGVCHNPAWFGSEEKEMGLLLHTTFWMQGLQEFAGPLPHVMLGDMNFAPSSPPHQWVTRTLPRDEPSRPWPWIWLLEEDTGKGMVGERYRRTWKPQTNKPMQSVAQKKWTVNGDGKFRAQLDYIFASQKDWEPFNEEQQDDVLDLAEPGAAVEGLGTGTGGEVEGGEHITRTSTRMHMLIPNATEPSDHILVSATLQLHTKTKSWT